MPRPDDFLAIALTDTSFERASWRGEEVWRGRCFHCGSPLWLHLDGRPISPVTIEHVRPRNQGGTEDPRNLALACPKCNHRKGRRVDARKSTRSEAILVGHEARRAARWREPGG